MSGREFVRLLLPKLGEVAVLVAGIAALLVLFSIL